MRIGRQSLYNAFGDKRGLYLAALDAYQQASVDGHIERLSAPSSPLAGVRDLLTGLIAEDEETRALGCMGVGAACEFGASDPDLAERRQASQKRLRTRLIARLREGRQAGEIDPSLDPEDAADFILIGMTGLQVAARAGAGAEQLKSLARFTTERLRAP
jgi:AcrR family transcriptional regulator